MGKIIATKENNIDDWAKLMCKLYTEDTLKSVIMECRGFLKNKKEYGFLYKVDNNFIAFINVSIRNDYVNGTSSLPVAFIEGIYVIEEYRNKGIARKLIEYAGKFAKESGCSQLASDSLISNKASQKFHESCGFKETERVVYFVKDV